MIKFRTNEQYNAREIINGIFKSYLIVYRDQKSYLMNKPDYKTKKIISFEVPYKTPLKEEDLLGACAQFVAKKGVQSVMKSNPGDLSLTTITNNFEGLPMDSLLNNDNFIEALKSNLNFEAKNALAKAPINDVRYLKHNSANNFVNYGILLENTIEVVKALHQKRHDLINNIDEIFEK